MSFHAEKLVDGRSWELAGESDHLLGFITATLAIIDNDLTVLSVRIKDTDGNVRLLYNRGNQ